MEFRNQSKQRIISEYLIIHKKKFYLKYDSKIQSYNKSVVQKLIYNKNLHIVAIFKDYMIYDFKEEFLKRSFIIFIKIL